MSTKFFGERQERVEDARLLTGKATFTDDLEPDAPHAAFVRSEHAHARIREIDVDDAFSIDGVLAVYTHEDLTGPFSEPLPVLRPHSGLHSPRTPTLLVAEEAHYVGEPIVMVIARDRYVAEDAVAAIKVTYDVLEPIVDPVAAADDASAPSAHSDMDNNLAGEFAEELGDVEAAFDDAHIVVEGTYTLDRGAAHPMEARAVIASYDSAADRLRVYDTTQAPMIIRNGLAAMFNMATDDVEVIAPMIGGGFGVKVFQFYPEEVLVPWAAKELRQTIKWTEDRREHFLGSNHCRKQVHTVRLALSRDGRILAYDVDYIQDNGAYCQYGMHMPVITACHLMGPYDIPNLRYRFRAVFTNTVPNTPYRGSGVPYTVLAQERTLDKAAAELGIDRAELRRRNLIPADAFPYHVGMAYPTGGTTSYDSGDYEKGLDLLLDTIGWEDFPAEQAAARAEGRRIGLGLACYVEASAAGPYEGAKVDVLADGSITVATAATPAGQGHETALSQIVAEEFDVPIDRIRVTTGDTRRIEYGMGTYASRTTALVGTAAKRASRDVIAKLTGIAGFMLEASLDDIYVSDGFARVKGVPQLMVPIGDIARAAQFIPPAARGQDQPGVAAVAYESGSEIPVFGSGMHAAVVEIDPETMDLRVLRYAIVHDCGRVLNPMLVEGQILGGFAQGLGGSFYEKLEYDEAGQLLNASFMDFLIPYATEIPSVMLRHTETPTPTNELGVKGAGEAGAIPVPAVIASAVEDAIGVHITDMPLSPQAMFALSGAAT